MHLHLSNPSLRRRLSMLLVLAVAAWLLLSLVASLFLLRMLRRNEATMQTRSETLALQVIDQALEQLRSSVEQAMAWQTLSKRLNPAGTAPSLTLLPWRNPRLDLFLVFDSAGKLVDRGERGDRSIPQDLQDIQYQVYLAALESQESLQGFAAGRRGIYLVAGRSFSKTAPLPGRPQPASTSGTISGRSTAAQDIGPSAFALAMRHLDEALVASVKKFADADVIFYSHGKPIISTVASAQQSIVDSSVVRRAENPSSLFSWAEGMEGNDPPQAISLNDFVGRPVAQMLLLHRNEDGRRLRSAIVAGALGFVGASLLIFGIAAIAMERWIVWPLHQLQTQVRNLQGNDQYGRRLAVTRHDEIGELATAINALMLQGETAQRQSLQAHALIQQIVQSAGVGIVALNHHGHVLILNQKLEETLGFTSEEVEMRGWFETICQNPEERQQAVEKWKKQLGNKVASNEEWQVTTPAGGKRVLAVITAPLQTPAGEAMGTISFCHDITKQKQLENQVEQTRRLASLGTLAGGIAHNFNNILCGILGYTTLGRERLPAGDPVREYFAIIERSASRASQLTQQLLMFSKGTQGAFQLVDLRPLIHEVVSLLRETLPKNITIEEIYHNDWLFLKADSSQLYQSLMNICLNARDAMPEGGRLTIESRLESYDTSSLPAPELASGRYVSLRISDTGTGMSDDVKQRVFEPFFTTKAPSKGTGLGLATVYGTIKGHQGHIHVISEPQQGTSFIIYLPALKDLFGGKESLQTPAPSTSHQLGAVSQQRDQHPRESAATGNPSSVPAHSKGNILVVEDEEMIGRSTKALLEEQGYTVCLVNDGAQALEYIQRRDTPWSAVILDLILPHVPGTRVWSCAKECLPGVPVIITSGFVEQTPHHFAAMKAMRGQQVSPKAQAVLHKPYTGQQLLDTLQEVLKNSVSRVGQER